MYSSKQKMKKRPQKCLATLQVAHLIHLFKHWRMMLWMWYGMYKHWITPSASLGKNSNLYILSRT